MDSQKGANWAQIIGTFIGAALLGYAVWDHWPTESQSVGVGWGGTMKGYVPPALIALILFGSSTLQLILWRRRQAARTNNTKLPLEILSPFDNEEVGLYEIVRGQVFPPGSALQVLVFAGDKKWYPQPAVDVRGSSWSVKCQFGNLDTPSSGAYKIVAVLGDELREGMWYSDLPTAAPKSNIITVHRPEITIEHKLAADAQESQELARERDGYKKELDRQISLKHDLDQSFQISRREVTELRAEANAQTNTYELTFKGMNEELAALKSELENAKEQYDEEHSAALRLKTLNEQYEMQIGKLTSDAEEGRKEKLAAASNLQSVESDRNNFRAWYNELSWLTPRLEPQQDDISTHVTVIAARPCRLDLKERVVIVDLVIRNDSFFDITIKHDAVTGQLSTNKKGLLHDPAEALVDLNHPAVKKLKPTKDARVSIIQRLLRTEAEEIEDALAQGSEGYFWLGSLNIPICVENAGTLEIDSRPLRMNSNVEHVYFREFGALEFDGEVITPGELLRDVEALPFPERARIYRELSKAYGESLWRLNEAREKERPLI